MMLLTLRSEEHTTELQSQFHLVCRLLLDTATTQIYTLSLHDALPISGGIPEELRSEIFRGSNGSDMGVRAVLVIGIIGQRKAAVGAALPTLVAPAAEAVAHDDAIDAQIGRAHD